MFSSTAASMSSSASAFGSPPSFGQTAPSFGQTAIGCPSPFSKPAPLSIGCPSPFSKPPTSPLFAPLTGYRSTLFSQTPATNASSSPGTGFGFTTASGQASMPWGSTYADPFVYQVPVPPVPCSPFATTVKPNLEPVLDKMKEWEKSTQLICKDVKQFQEDMKSWIERDKSLEMATQTINQLREELARVTRSKEAIIAEYLASPEFTKRLDEEHEKRLSKIFHPCYVKALGEVQPATGWFPPSPVTSLFSGHNPNSEQENKKTYI